MILPDNLIPADVKYVVVADFYSKPALFRPFMVKNLSEESWRTMLRD
jgi:hypothetical protein